MTLDRDFVIFFLYNHRVNVVDTFTWNYFIFIRCNRKHFRPLLEILRSSTYDLWVRVNLIITYVTQKQKYDTCLFTLLKNIIYKKYYYFL